MITYIKSKNTLLRIKNEILNFVFYLFDKNIKISIKKKIIF